MELTDSERVEFIALANDTLDPEIWTEDDLPALRRAREQYESERSLESDTLHNDQPGDMAEDDEGTWPDSDAT